MKKMKILIGALFFMNAGLSAQSLSLDSCKHFALKNNKKLKESRLHFEAAQQVKKGAFTHYFPQIEAGAVAMNANKGLLEIETPSMNLPVYNGNPATLPTATEFTFVPGMNFELIDYTNMGFVMAVQPIYMGGKIVNGNKLAELGIEVNELMVELTSNEVIANTEMYYWTIVSLSCKMKTLWSYQKLLNNLLADVELAYKSGLIQKGDMLKVQLKLNELESDKLKLENGISILKMTLAQYMGIDYENGYSLSDTVMNIVEPTKLYVNTNEALSNRVEYQLLNKAIDAEVLQKKMARSEYMPQVAVGAQAYYLDIMENQTTNGLGFAIVTVPISGWWGGSHKINEHQIKVEIAQNNLDEKAEMLKLQMNKAYNDLNESFMQITVAELSQNQALEHFTVVQDNFNAGVVSTSDLLEAQAMLQQSQNALLDAKTNYKIKQSIYLQTIAQLQ